MPMEKAYWDYVVNGEEMQRADENTISCFGVPQLVLMERAALAAKEMMEAEWPDIFARRAHILLALGNGNNGGDGAALARLFYLSGHQVTVLVSGKEEKYSSALKKQLEILERYKSAGEEGGAFASGRGKLSVLTDEKRLQKRMQEEPGYDLIVDALFGIGLSRMIDGPCREKILWLNGLSGKKAALDIPSGVSAENGRIWGTAFRADLTVTFGFLKAGMLLYPGKECCGESKVADIGITEESFLKEYPAGLTMGRGGRENPSTRYAEGLPFRRKQDGHKGSFGKVLLFAGSTGAGGAALLTGEAVLRSGAGMLRIVSCAENRELVLTRLPEAMYQESGENTDWEKLLDWCDAVVAGPGIGTGSLAEESLKKIVTLLSEKFREKPLVLDADGLNLAAASRELAEKLREHTALGGIVIMTPHMAELGRLLHCAVDELQAERMERTKRFAAESGAIMVSKDAATIVCYTDGAGDFHYYINQTGNSGMATAGSGDVLSGITGAFAAFAAVRQREWEKGISGKRPDPATVYFEAVCKAVYAHGAAGDKAAKKYGEVSMKAGDIIGMLSAIFSVWKDDDRQGTASGERKAGREAWSWI